MARINWLHLSDWHQKTNEFDRKVIAKKLIDDIKTREKIDRDLGSIDFIVFSGDLAFSGEKNQFELAHDLLIGPIRNVIGPRIPIFCVPGNHDIDRRAIPRIPNEMASTLIGRDSQAIEQLLQDEVAVELFNRPLTNFYDFAKKLDCGYSARKLHLATTIEKSGHKIGIACLNTAWLSARANIQRQPSKAEKEIWDRGILRMTEAQIRGALDEITDTDIAIAIMHHPMHWLEETEQAKAEQMIAHGCHVVLHGHEHRPNMNRLSNAFGDVVIVPAGASYNRRIASDPRYTNAYNFCSVDLDTNVGTIFHRIWSEERDRWVADDRFWSNGRSLFFIQKKQAIEQEKMARNALNQLSANYLESVYKRQVKEQNILLKHKGVNIDGELFIKASVRIRMKFHAGNHEAFPIRTRINSRILSHPSQKVREFAYRLQENAVAGPLNWNSDGSQCELTFELSPEEKTIEYEYEMLEMVDGLYYFNLRRFTDHVIFTLMKEPYCEYEDLPFGGFPSKRPVIDRITNSDVWETDKPSLPNQGLVLQWYPMGTSASK